MLEIKFEDVNYKARGGSLFVSELDPKSPEGELVIKNYVQMRFTHKIVDLMGDDDGLDVILDESHVTEVSGHLQDSLSQCRSSPVILFSYHKLHRKQGHHLGVLRLSDYSPTSLPRLPRGIAH